MTTFPRSAMLLAALVVAVVGAPAAAATPEDDFCRSMAAIGFTDDCATLTALAREACAELDGGARTTDVAETLDSTTQDTTLSNFIVAGARLYFCPEPQTT